MSSASESGDDARARSSVTTPTSPRRERSELQQNSSRKDSAVAACRRHPRRSTIQDRWTNLVRVDATPSADARPQNFHSVRPGDYYAFSAARFAPIISFQGSLYDPAHLKQATKVTVRDHQSTTIEVQ